MPGTPEPPAEPRPTDQSATAEDRVRDAPPETLTSEEKAKLGEEISRSEDA